MSADTYAADLLAGLGGQPCTDRDDNQPGVWLPVSAWKDLCSLTGHSSIAASIARTGRERAQLLDAYEQTERHAACTDIASNPLRCVR